MPPTAKTKASVPTLARDGCQLIIEISMPALGDSRAVVVSKQTLVGTRSTASQIVGKDRGAVERVSTSAGGRTQPLEPPSCIRAVEMVRKPGLASFSDPSAAISKGYHVAAIGKGPRATQQSRARAGSVPPRRDRGGGPVCLPWAAIPMGDTPGHRGTDAALSPHLHGNASRKQDAPRGAERG
jgi:hypothetical protein